jgi:hypothetical protein
MVKEFCRASQRALKEGAIQQAIIPIHLRTTPSSEIQFLPGVHREVSEEKVQEIAKINLSSYRNAGRHRTKPLKDILEMLLEQEYFGYSRSEFIRHFPAARAAEAQKRRWKKRGIWLQISQILQS